MGTLPQKLSKGPFSWEEAKSAGLTQYALRLLLETGKVERLAHGVYRSTEEVDLSPEDQYKAVLLRVGKPSAICLISALAYYHLTDVIPKQTWALVGADKLSNQKDIRLWRRRNPRWRIGIIVLDEVRITNVERTLIECLHHKNLIGGTALAIDAIRLAIQEKKTTMSDLLKMAERLGVKNKILPYLEVLT